MGIYPPDKLQRIAQMIDWLTIRVPLNAGFSEVVKQRLEQYMGVLTNTDRDGVVMWRKPTLDVDALR
jgi:hypothetical protein